MGDDEVVHDTNFLNEVKHKLSFLTRDNEILHAQMRVFNTFERLIQMSGGMNGAGFDDFNWRFDRYVKNIEDQKDRAAKRKAEAQEKAKREQYANEEKVQGDLKYAVEEGTATQINKGTSHLSEEIRAVPRRDNLRAGDVSSDFPL